MHLRGVTYDIPSTEYPTFELEFETYGMVTLEQHPYKRLRQIDIQFRDPILMEVTVRDLVVSCLGFLESHNPGYAAALDAVKAVNIKEPDIVDSTARDITNVRQLNGSS